MVSISFTDGRTPSEATYLAVAEAKECDALDLPPLADTIDADALDAIVIAPACTDDFSMKFEYAGCSVTITTEEVRVSND